MKLHKILIDFSPGLMKQAFSLNASVLNPDVLSQLKMKHSLIFLAPKIEELIRKKHKKTRDY